MSIDVDCLREEAKIQMLERLTNEEAAVQARLLNFAVQAPGSSSMRRLHRVVDVRVARSVLRVVTDTPEFARGLRQRFQASEARDPLPIELRLSHVPGNEAICLLVSPYRVIAAQLANHVLSFVIRDTSNDATCFASVGGFREDRSEHGQVGDEIRLDMLQCLVEIEMLHSARIADPTLQFVHASCVSYAGNAALLLGPSGSGKTTTALGLALLGFDLLSDDTACLDLERRMIYPYPRVPRVRPQSGSLLRSCRESMNLVDFTGDLFPRVATTPVPLAALIFLGGFTDSPLMQRLRPDEALWSFLDYLFNRLYQPVSIRFSQHRVSSDLARYIQDAACCVASLAAYRCLLGDLERTATVVQQILSHETQASHRSQSTDIRDQ